PRPRTGPSGSGTPTTSPAARSGSGRSSPLFAQLGRWILATAHRTPSPCRRSPRLRVRLGTVFALLQWAGVLGVVAAAHLVPPRRLAAVGGTPLGHPLLVHGRRSSRTETNMSAVTLGTSSPSSASTSQPPRVPTSVIRPR